MEKDILGLLETDAQEDLRFNDFLSWERASRDTIDFKKIYVDIAGDLIAGLLLSQIIYWYLPDREGKTKLRVIKRGRPCIAKARHDWWDEVRISPKQYDRAVGILRKLGILRTKNYRFNGVPIPHLFLQQKQLLQLINKELTAPKENPTFPKGQSPLSPKVKVHLPQRSKSLTETTTKITSENTINVNDTFIESLFEYFKIPKKDRSLWNNQYRDDKDYLLQQLRYAREKGDSIKNPTRWIQKALDNDYAGGDNEKIEERERAAEVRKQAEDFEARGLSREAGVTLETGGRVDDKAEGLIKTLNKLILECKKPDTVSLCKELKRELESGESSDEVENRFFAELLPAIKERQPVKV